MKELHFFFNFLDNIEQQCEDAVFEVCDARERYPSRCADELQKSIKLKNNMNVMNDYNRFYSIFIINLL